MLLWQIHCTLLPCLEPGSAGRGSAGQQIWVQLPAGPPVALTATADNRLAADDTGKYVARSSSNDSSFPILTTRPAGCWTLIWPLALVASFPWDGFRS
jgi:hypothetical protein